MHSDDHKLVLQAKKKLKRKWRRYLRTSQTEEANLSKHGTVSLICGLIGIILLMTVGPNNPPFFFVESASIFGLLFLIAIGA